jgi:hypothetical protein
LGAEPAGRSACWQRGEQESAGAAESSTDDADPGRAEDAAGTGGRDQAADQQPEIPVPKQPPAPFHTSTVHLDQQSARQCVISSSGSHTRFVSARKRTTACATTLIRTGGINLP